MGHLVVHFFVFYAQRTRRKGRKEVDTGMSLLLPRPQKGNALDKLSHRSEGGWAVAKATTTHKEHKKKYLKDNFYIKTRKVWEYKQCYCKKCMPFMGLLVVSGIMRRIRNAG